MKENRKYAAFLRGINVGGHHKVPMADLKKEMAALGFAEVETLLNSGNIIFSASETEESNLEEVIAARLKEVYGFQVPVLVRRGEELLQLFARQPFKEVELTHDTRLYVSFLKHHPQEIELPWVSEDQALKILEVQGRSVISVLDVGQMGSTKGMEMLERIFGKNITTRNWNTIEKIVGKIKS